MSDPSGLETMRQNYALGIAAATLTLMLISFAISFANLFKKSSRTIGAGGKENNGGVRRVNSLPSLPIGAGGKENNGGVRRVNSLPSLLAGGNKRENKSSSTDEARTEDNTNEKTAGSTPSPIEDITLVKDDSSSTKEQTPRAQEKDATEETADIPPSSNFTPEKNDDSSSFIGSQETSKDTQQTKIGEDIAKNLFPENDTDPALIAFTYLLALKFKFPEITSVVKEFDRNIKERLTEIKSEELSNIESDANNRIHEILTIIDNKIILNQEEINRFIDWFKTSAKKLNADQILVGLAFYLKNKKILNHNEENKEIYVGDNKLRRKIMHEITEKLLKEKTMDLKKIVEILNDKFKNEGKNYQLITVKQEKNGGLLEQINDIFRPARKQIITNRLETLGLKGEIDSSSKI